MHLCRDVIELGGQGIEVRDDFVGVLHDRGDVSLFRSLQRSAVGNRFLAGRAAGNVHVAIAQQPDGIHRGHGVGADLVLKSARNLQVELHGALLIGVGRYPDLGNAAHRNAGQAHLRALAQIPGAGKVSLKSVMAGEESPLAADKENRDGKKGQADNYHDADSKLGPLHTLVLRHSWSPPRSSKLYCSSSARGNRGIGG